MATDGTLKDVTAARSCFRDPLTVCARARELKKVLKVAWLLSPDVSWPRSPREGEIRGCVFFSS